MHAKRSAVLLNVIVGSSSNFSKALQSYCLSHGLKFIVIDTAEVKNWNLVNRNFLNPIRSVLESQVEHESKVKWIWTIGITNPRVGRATLDFVNVELPIAFAKAIKDPNSMLVFPGALMENFESLCIQSPYLTSKLHFSQAIESVDTNWVNLRFSVWYGQNKIGNHLFLGQVIQCIREDSQFMMSGGRQLREYHHIDDDVAVVFTDFSGKLHSNLNVTHGESFTLKFIAESIFKSVNKVHLLSVGKHPSNPQENYDLYFDRSPHFNEIVFRETIPSLLKYVHKQVGGPTFE